mgnify:CR=1 FL=1
MVGKPSRTFACGFNLVPFDILNFSFISEVLGVFFSQGDVDSPNVTVGSLLHILSTMNIKPIQIVLVDHYFKVDSPFSKKLRY